MKKVYVTVYPHTVQEGVIIIPDDVDEKDYITEHFDAIQFKDPDLDYCGCTMDVSSENVPNYDYTWDLSDEQWEKYCSHYNRGTNFDCILGFCRVGEICFDIESVVLEDNQCSGIGFSCFVRNGDTGCSYSPIDGTPYNEYGISDVLGPMATMTYEEFKTQMESELNAYIALNSHDLKQYAEKPLHVW